MMPSSASLAVRIVVDDHALSGFVPALAAALRHECKAQVSVRINSASSHTGNTALHTLLSLEKMVVRRGRRCWSDRIDQAELNDLLEPSSLVQPDLVIDLTEAMPDHEVPVLQPLFNGAAGEEALASALLFGGTPRIEVAFRQSPSGSLVVVEQGEASLEAAGGIGGAMEAVWSRTLVLLVKAVRLGLPGAVEGRGMSGRDKASFRPLRPLDAVRYSSSMLAAAAASAAYRLCCYRPHWRIGWRFTRMETDVWSRRDLNGVPWSVLKDPIDHFYADPFPLFWQGRDYMFFEDLDHKIQKGIISVVEFDASGRPGPVIPVLEEPWHLSYPFLIESDGEIWMIPEASQSGEITVYRARNFPRDWERHTALVTDIEAADATIISHGGKMWMFAVVRQAIGGYSDTLAIWTSGQLFGTWSPLQNNPVLVDDRTARPAGAFVMRGGQLMRPVQDCRNGYGAALSLARVTRLDESGFEQVIETHLAPGRAWPGRKLHTLNSNGRLEAIDGSILRPKSALAANLVDRLYQPAD
jgi:hypothetical protein